MLIALMTILFFGGSSTGMLDFIAETGDSIKTEVENDERRKDALATVKELKKRTKTRNKQVKRARKDLATVLRSQMASDSDIDLVWDEYFSEIEDYNQDVLNLRFELLDHLTRDEWQRVFAATEAE